MTGDSPWSRKGTPNFKLERVSGRSKKLEKVKLDWPHEQVAVGNHIVLGSQEASAWGLSVGNKALKCS